MNIKKIFSQIGFSFATVHKHAKMAFYISFLSKIISTSKVYLFAWLNKKLLDNLSIALLSKESATQLLLPLLYIILFNWLAVLVYNALDNFFNYLTTCSMMKYNIITNHILYSKLSTIDMAYYDSPKENDKIKHAFKDMTGIVSVYESSLNIISSFISFVIALQIVASFNWIIATIIIAVLIPSFFINKYLSIENYKMDEEMTSFNRKIEYFASMFFNQSIAQDIRIWDISKFFLRKHLKLSEERNDRKKDWSKKNTKIDLVHSTIVGLINGALNLFILYEIIVLRMTIGDYTYYSSITSNLRQSLQSCIEKINDLYISCVKVSNHRAFINSRNLVITSGTEEIPSDNMQIEFLNVSFVYPNSNQKVLDNLNFSFGLGQKIAFSGINGAGKTTIIKLLLRFYDPTDGVILLNGKDIKSYDIKKYRKLFSVMFQNYSNYKITIKENISLCEDGSDEGVYKALSFVDLKIDDINLEYSKSFSDDGIILSTGQSQRLNLARTIYRKAPVCILDEPSASLDAKAEQDIFDRVFEASKNSGLILISHRLSNLQYVDKVIFLEQGKAIEIGTHEELIKLNGVYSELYGIQSKKYQSVSANEYTKPEKKNSH